MNRYAVRKACQTDFEVISNIIAAKNRNPETHCIHSDAGGGEQSILNEIIRLDANAEICFVVSLIDNQITGVMGCEIDQELGRGWIRGPFIDETTKDWRSEAAALFQGLLDTLPPAIHQLDTFLNIANTRGNDFYLGQDFEKIRLVHVYETDSLKTSNLNAQNCEPLSAQQSQDFIDLHKAVFPHTYASGQRILEKLGDQQQVFVQMNGNEMLGYLYAIVVEETGEGSIEFVGVREDSRGKGIGRQLLQTALYWLFEVKKVPRVALVVNDDSANARSLYESVGFRLKFTGVHTRKKWED